jgi:hypothetical protein
MRVIETWHDGYLWCATVRGDFIGRFATEGDAFAAAYAETCRLANFEP